jgi:serine protease
VEEEPNDETLLAFPLPPVAPGTILEATGELGVTPERYGRADPVEHLRFVSVLAQQVTVDLEFTPEMDPVGGLENALHLEIFDSGGGAVTSTPSGPSPQVTVFDALAGEEYRVVLTIDAGHAAWLLRFIVSEPTPVAKPLLAAAGALPGPRRASGAATTSDFVPGRLLVRLAEGADAEAVARRLGGSCDGCTACGTWRFCLPPESAGRVEADPEVLWAEPDWIVRPLGGAGDPDFNRQWNLRAVGATGAWGVSTGDPSVVIGVVDTGVTTHPAIAGGFVDGYDFISDPSISGDGDGRDADPTDTGDRGKSSGLSTWHGTGVASVIVAARDDGVGVAGIAPGCRVMPLRALGAGGGAVSDVSDAILFAAGLHTTADGRSLDTPLRVVNLSFGLTTDSAELRDACQRAANLGVLLVAASGNNGGAVLFPASYPSVIAVGAVTGALERPSYSNFGRQLALVAPGGRSSEDAAGDGWPDGIPTASFDETRDPAPAFTALQAGTSFAAPHVAAALGLLFSIEPSLFPSEARDLLLTTALDLGVPGRDDGYGSGLLQVNEAVRALLASRGMPRADPPALLLHLPSLKFHGFDESFLVPISNAGGGTLSVTGVHPVTDDGAPWLFAVLQPALPGGPSAVTGVSVLVERGLVPPGPGRYSGTLRFFNDDGVLGTLRIVMLVEFYNHAGLEAQVYADEEESGINRAFGSASPVTGYRWRLEGLAAGPYLVQAGVDLDGDGFPCEAAEACGWYGGPTPADAIPAVVETEAVTTGVDVVLYP